MYRENHYYGHAEALLSYCDSKATAIPLMLQHGWQVGPGIPPNERNVAGNKLVWSSRNVQQAQEAGHQDFVPTGAPYLYLPELPDKKPDDRSLLVVPFHGWERDKLAGSLDGYAQHLERLVAEGFGPITVCMYWFEYQQPRLRESFESRGFSTVTMGHRDDNPEFLSRMRELICRHRYVTSNRVSTAAFYALASDRPFFLWGPTQGLSQSDAPSGEQFDQWQRNEFPELCFEAFGDRCAIDTGRRELGAEHLRSPDDLKDLLLLGDANRWPRAQIRIGRWRRSLSQRLRRL